MESCSNVAIKIGLLALLLIAWEEFNNFAWGSWHFCSWYHIEIMCI